MSPFSGYHSLFYIKITHSLSQICNAVLTPISPQKNIDYGITNIKQPLFRLFFKN